MTIENISFKNIDQEAEDFLYSRTKDLMSTIGERADFKAYFEKAGEYAYTGSIEVNSEWGNIYTTLKDHNVFRLYNRLKDKVKKQVSKKKEQFDNVQRIPLRLPKYQLVDASYPTTDLLVNYLMTTDVQPRKIVNVLIVDDDVDSALALDSIFKRFGCNTTFALDYHEARKQITSGKADIIILDWMLNESVKADQIVMQSINTIEKFKVHRHIPKVITCSSLKDSKIHFPKSKYFEYLEHWQKPIQYNDITKKTFNLLETMTFRG